MRTLAKNKAMRLVRLHRTIEKITKISLQALGARPLKIREQNSLMAVIGGLNGHVRALEWQ